MHAKRLLEQIVVISVIEISRHLSKLIVIKIIFISFYNNGKWWNKIFPIQATNKIFPGVLFIFFFVIFVIF